MKCAMCNTVPVNRYVLGYIDDSKYIDLCKKCSLIFESIPDHIPKEQNVKYLKKKLNEK